MQLRDRVRLDQRSVRRRVRRFCGFLIGRAEFCPEEEGEEAVGTGSGGIVVYNAQHENLTQAWAEEFTKETGIAVEMRNGSDNELGNQLVAEGSGSPADVFLTENSPGMNIVEKAGLFAPVDAATAAQVPAKFNPSTGNWVGIAARSTVFVYNPDLLPESELPSSIMDLKDPAWAVSGPPPPAARTSRRSSARSCSSRAPMPPPPGWTRCRAAPRPTAATEPS